jgi:hypothetical protein
MFCQVKSEPRIENDAVVFYVTPQPLGVAICVRFNMWGQYTGQVGPAIGTPAERAVKEHAIDYMNRNRAQLEPLFAELRRAAGA